MLSISFFTLVGFFFKKISKNFILILFSISITITLIESILLFLNTGKILEINTGKKNLSNIKYEKTFLGYQPSPGIYKYSDKYYTIGNNKFRITPEINDLKKNKTINFFGGSFTFGYGLNDNETMPYLLQKYFNDWKINNYGINGYGVHQMLAQIQRNPEIIADINILITVEGHIPRATCKRHFSFGTPKYILDKNKQLQRSGYCHFGFLDGLPIPKIFGSIINRSEIKNYIFNFFNNEKNFYNKKNKELYVAIIKEINKIVTNNNKKLFVGYMESSDELNKSIIAMLLKNNIDIIDLSLDKNNNDYWLLDRHTSKKGNEKRVFIIHDYLKKFKLN